MKNFNLHQVSTCICCKTLCTSTSSPACQPAMHSACQEQCTQQLRHTHTQWDADTQCTVDWGQCANEAWRQTSFQNVPLTTTVTEEAASHADSFLQWKQMQLGNSDNRQVHPGHLLTQHKILQAMKDVDNGAYQTAMAWGCNTGHAVHAKLSLGQNALFNLWTWTVCGNVPNMIHANFSKELTNTSTTANMCTYNQPTCPWRL